MPSVAHPLASASRMTEPCTTSRTSSPRVCGDRPAIPLGRRMRAPSHPPRQCKCTVASTVDWLRGPISVWNLISERATCSRGPRQIRASGAAHNTAVEDVSLAEPSECVRIAAVPRLSYVFVWPPTGHRRLRWVRPADRDAFVKTARRVCELYTSALLPLEIENRR